MAFSRIMAALCEDGRFDVHGDGTQSRDFTFAGDAVAATIRAMEDAPSGAIYNVGGGKEATLLEVIEECERIAGTSLRIRWLPPAPGDVRRTAAETTRIRRDLDWRPRTPLPDGLRAQWDWTVAATRMASAS
jgi:UDP-glucose 4-epimerase